MYIYINININININIHIYIHTHTCVCVCVAAGEQDAPGILPDPRFVPPDRGQRELPGEMGKNGVRQCIARLCHCPLCHRPFVAGFALAVRRLAERHESQSDVAFKDFFSPSLLPCRPNKGLPYCARLIVCSYADLMILTNKRNCRPVG